MAPQKEHIEIDAAKADFRSYFYNLPTNEPQHVGLWPAEEGEYHFFEVDHALFGNLHSTFAATILPGALAEYLRAEIELPVAMYGDDSNLATPRQIIHEPLQMLLKVFKEIGVETAGEREAVAARDLLKSIGMLGLNHSPLLVNGLQCVGADCPEQKKT